MLLHRPREREKREEAQLLLDACRKVFGPTSAQTEGEREARPLLDGCARISPPEGNRPLLDGCRKKVTGTASAQTEGARPLLDDCQEAT